MRPPPPNYGPYSSEQDALRTIVDRLVEGLEPFRIYLFGSRAEGRARPDSDFDLVVVFDDEAPNSEADYDEVFAPVLDLPIGCDVIPCRWSDFQEVLADSSNPWQDNWGAARRVYQTRRVGLGPPKAPSGACASQNERLRIGKDGPQRRASSAETLRGRKVPALSQRAGPLRPAG